MFHKLIQNKIFSENTSREDLLPKGLTYKNVKESYSVEGK